MRPTERTERLSFLLPFSTCREDEEVGEEVKEEEEKRMEKMKWQHNSSTLTGNPLFY